MRNTQHKEPNPRQLNQQEKRRKLWQAMQPPPKDYPQREVTPWKVEG